MDSEELVVHASKTKTLLLLVLAVGFVLLGLWFLSLDREFIEARDRYNNPMLIYAVGWASVSFFGLAVVAIVWRLVSRKPVLTLSKDGVKIYAFSQDTFLPWQDICGLSVYEVHRNKMLVLNLKDPGKYIETGSKIRRSLARASYKMCGSPIAIPSSTVGLRFRELQELFEDYIRRYAGAA